jgi:hypothetical protein
MRRCHGSAIAHVMAWLDEPGWISRLNSSHLSFTPPVSRTAQIDASNIAVEVHGSKAILKDSVRSWAERREAERQAWLAPGIISVENQITLL